MGLGGSNARSEHFIMDEGATLLKDKLCIRERWGGLSQTLLNKKSPKLDPTISILFPQRPLTPSLGDEPTMHNMTGVIRGTPNWKAVGPDSLPAELLKLDHHEFIRCYLSMCGERETSPSNGKMPSSRSLIKDGSL